MFSRETVECVKILIQTTKYTVPGSRLHRNKFLEDLEVSRDGNLSSILYD